MDPRSAGAERIAELGWVMIGLAAVVCVVVFGALLYGLRANRQPAEASPEIIRQTNDGDRLVVILGLVIPAALLVFTFGYTVFTLREVAGVAGAGGAAAFASHEHTSAASPSASSRVTIDARTVEVRVTGHQWWWQVDYPAEQLVTANEIHVPAGLPIRLSVTSSDVIHSFWVPQIAGKVDLIPDKINTLEFVVQRPGVYRGMCSEFCGLQHAHMHLRLVVQPANDFERWVEAQRREPSPPTSPDQAAGLAVFQARCAECHAIRGISRGTQGPDLTHLASRATLGAGIHENDRASLEGWTTNAQAMKPGNTMPSIPLTAEETRVLVDYLESLQ